MNAATTICCSALALIAVTQPKPATPVGPVGPVALVPAHPVWTLALNSPLSVPPAYDHARVFFGIEPERLVAYDIVSGEQQWLVDAHPLFQPATGNDRIYIVEENGITALLAEDGSPDWKVPLPDPLVMQPVWDNGWLIALTAQSALAFRGTDGHLVWQRDLGAAPHAPPALAADRVYVSLADGRVTALNVTDGTPVWERKVGGQPNEILALADRLYVGSTDNFFYCLMTKDGRIDWRWRTGADVMGMPVADDKRVYFVSFDNVIRALSLTSGGQQWMRPLPFRPAGGPKLAGGTLVAIGQSQFARTFSTKDGSPTEDIDAGDDVASPPHLLTQPLTGLPMMLFTTKHIARGAAAVLLVRTVEPPLVPAVSPLPNPIKPEPMRVTR